MKPAFSRSRRAQKCPSHLVFLAAAGLAFLANEAFGASRGPIEIKKVKHNGPVDFDKEILPFLKANCVSCHNKTTSKGELNLESPEAISKGGESGKAIIPGKGKESLLVRYAAHLEESPMPPKDNKVKAVNLTPEELGLLCLWIDQGAKASPKKERTIAWEPVPEAIKSIYTAALTADGHYAACSRGGQIYVYHLPTRQLMTRLADDTLVGRRAHRDLIPALAFSPDGKRLASGSFEEIKIWQREDQISTKNYPADASRALQSPPNSLDVDIATTKQHLSGSKDGTAILWDAEKKNKLKEFKHGAELIAMAASPDGSRVATSGADKSVKIWDAASGVLVAELKGNRAANDAAAAAARIAAYRQSEVTYRTNALKAGEGELSKLQKRVTTVTGDLKTAQDGVEPKVKAREAAAKVKSDLEAALPPAAASGDAAAAKKRKEADDKLAEAVKKLSEAEGDVSRAHEAVAHQELELKLANEHVAKKTKEIADFKTAIAEAEQLQKTADGDLKSKQEAAAAQQRLVRVIAFSSESLRLATASDDGKLHLWSAIDGAALQTLPGASSTGVPPHPPGAAVPPPSTLQWDGDTLSATFADGSRVIHRLTAQWKLERTLSGGSSSMKDRVNALRFSPDGKTLAAGSGEFSRGGELTLWSVETGALEKVLADLHKDTILALSFTADGRHLATGSADKAVKVLDTKTWTTLKSIEGHTSHVLSVAWRAEGRTLATASADNSVKIWDFQSGDRKKNIESWDAEVTSVQFVGMTGNLLAACGDKRVRLLNDSGGEVRAFPDCKDFMQYAAASDDGNIIIAGGHDGILLLWNGVTGKVLAKFPAP
ncbi:MAG TPA: c-type cytochrome domain-containing protein [Planctomycetota bacterium]|nr:c-type cytochrome domain-containing protein [Planctomycetota bacterium]